MSACGVRADDVTAVLFTHDHTDHCKGVATFHKRHPQVPLYANGNTADAIATLTGVEDGWRVFETTEPFSIGEIEVTSFSIPHDAADTVGYLFSDGTASLFVGTDMGIPTLPVKEALARATCAVLESNHDPTLLAPPRLKTLLLAHLSRPCNAPHLALESMREALKDIDRADVALAALDQDEPSDMYEA